MRRSIENNLMEKVGHFSRHRLTSTLLPRTAKQKGATRSDIPHEVLSRQPQMSSNSCSREKLLGRDELPNALHGALSGLHVPTFEGCSTEAYRTMIGYNVFALGHSGANRHHDYHSPCCLTVGLPCRVSDWRHQITR